MPPLRIMPGRWLIYLILLAAAGYWLGLTPGDLQRFVSSNRSLIDSALPRGSDPGPPRYSDSGPDELPGNPDAVDPQYVPDNQYASDNRQLDRGPSAPGFAETDPRQPMRRSPLRNPDRRFDSQNDPRDPNAGQRNDRQVDASPRRDCVPRIREEFTARVVSISDGDTLRILLPDKQNGIVRLVGVDAPEKGQDFGDKARSALGELVANRDVVIQNTGIDQYGRYLAYVKVGDREVNAQLLAEGWVWHYTHFNCEPEFAALEKTARAEHRGLWVEASPQPPWEFRMAARHANPDAGRQRDRQRDRNSTQPAFR